MRQFKCIVNPISKTKVLTVVQIGIVFISGKHLKMLLLPGYHSMVLCLVFLNCQNMSWSVNLKGIPNVNMPNLLLSMAFRKHLVMKQLIFHGHLFTEFCSLVTMIM